MITDDPNRNASLTELGREAAGVAHDFDNALTAIVSHAALIRSRSQDPTSIEHAEAILRAAEVAGGIVERVRRLFRGDGGPRRVRVSLGGLVRDVCDTAGARASARGVGLVPTLPGDPPEVGADRAELVQALTNLTHNAIDAASSAVRIIVDREGPRARVRVVDDGPGIPPDVRARMFETGFTTRAHGSGLGMSGALRAIAAHDGELQVRSDASGTTVEVTLPILTADAHLEPHRPMSDLQLDAAPVGARVLVVDDDRATREAIAVLLDAVGMVPSQAANPADALRLFQAAPPDCIVCDVTLGDVSARQLIDRLGILDPRVPVLLVTGLDPTAIPGAMRARAAAVMQKPFSPNRLLDLVRRLVTERRAVQTSGAPR